MTPLEIQEQLKQKNMTAAKLARRWRRSKTAISFLIHGKVNSRRLEQKLADLLGVPVEEIRNR